MLVSLRKLGDYYTIQAAAEELGQSYWSIYGYIRRAHVPTVRLGSTILVKLDDLRGLASTQEAGRSSTPDDKLTRVID